MELEERLLEFAASKLGWRPGIKGERLYDDARRVARDAAWLVVSGFDVSIEPRGGRQGRLLEIPTLLLYDKLATKIMKAEEPSEALERIVETLATIFERSLLNGEKVSWSPEYIGVLEPLIEVGHLLARLEARTHPSLKKVMKVIEREKPWKIAAYTLAPWRLPIHELLGLPESAGKKLLEKIRRAVEAR